MITIAEWWDVCSVSKTIINHKQLIDDVEQRHDLMSMDD